MSELPISKRQRLKLDLKAAHIALREVSKHAEAETKRADEAEERASELEASRDKLQWAADKFLDRIGQLETVKPSDGPFKLTVDLKNRVQRVYHDVTSWESFNDRLVIKRGGEVVDEIGDEYEGLWTG